ncbi:unnamed protein product [Calypogeia fissa]
MFFTSFFLGSNLDLIAVSSSILSILDPNLTDWWIELIDLGLPISDISILCCTGQLMETMHTSSSKPWWSKDTIAVVTGANKGLGFEIVRLLAEQGLTVVLTARDSGKGQEAVDELKKDGQKSVCFHQLDVESKESVETIAAWLKSKFGGIDILVNNAGVAFGPKGESGHNEIAKAIIETNYYGVKNVTEGLLPLLRKSPSAARIVNVTAGLGLYERLRSDTLKQKFKDYESLRIMKFKDYEKYTQELIDSLVTKFLEDVKADRSGEEWMEGEVAVSGLYGVSKIFLSAYSILLARTLSELQPEDHQILVTTFTPGLTDTDMMKRGIEEGSQAIKDRYKVAGGFKPKTAAEGADTGVWLALLPKEELMEKNGKFFYNRKEFSFGALRI